MKNTSKWWVRLCYIALFPVVLLNSCKKDDNGLQQELQNKHEHLEHNTSERVDAADIPEIMDFVRQKSNGDLTFTLQGRPGTREPDLTNVEVITSDIMAMTNETDKTNYSFKMDASEANDDEVINFVVKEKLDGVYGYIIRYRPTIDWMVAQDWNEFSGDVIFYEVDGTYVAMQTLQLGSPIASDIRVPCNNGGSGSGGGGTQGGNGNGSGSGSGSGSTGSGSGTGSGTGTGGGGMIITVITCGCSPGHIGGNNGPFCTGCSLDDVELVLTEIKSMDPTGEIENFLRTGDPCPPVEDCYDEFLDPCVCAPDGVTCLVVEENEEVGVNTSLSDYMLANEIEENIISTNLNPCPDTILTELKSLTQNDIAKIIFKFDPPTTPYTWEIESSIPSIPQNAAETDRKDVVYYEYLTKVKPSYTDIATKNAIARTILHEMIHAYLISHVDDVNAGNGVDVRDFLQLWQNVINDPASGTTEAAQHLYMAQRFVPHIKDALKEWDDETQSDQYYEDLAWGALLNTNTFDHFHPEGSPSRERIQDTNLAEDTNSTQGGIIPQGDPCQ